jgi:hypothetical protein
MKFTLIAWAVLSLALIGCTSDAAAQDAQPGPDPQAPRVEPHGSSNAKDTLGTIAPPPPPAVSVDGILDALDRQGDQMKDFTADVALTESDEVTRESFTRAGKVKFQRLPDDDARIYVIFETRQSGEGKARPEKIEYLLEKGWLTERNHRRKENVRRQVLKPGEKINLLKLGEGPFPLPIGQAKEDVKEMFEVTVIPPALTDPTGTVHGRLKPKPKTQFERRFSAIDVWVDPAAQMPRRIETLDRNEQTRQTTDLKEVKANVGLADADFRLDAVNAKDGWKLRDEPYEE